MTADLSPRTREEVVQYLTMLRDFAAEYDDDLGAQWEHSDSLVTKLYEQCGENARDHLIDAIGEALTLLGVPNGGE